MPHGTCGIIKRRWCGNSAIEKRKMKEKEQSQKEKKRKEGRTGDLETDI